MVLPRRIPYGSGIEAPLPGATQETGDTMSRNKNLRWKRKAVVVAAIAASFAGYAAIGISTASASDYAQWECSDLAASSVGSDEQCTMPTDDTDDTVPNETYPDETIPDTIPDTVPDTNPDTTTVVTDPKPTVPVTTQPSKNFPPAPTTAAPTVAPAVAAEVIPAPAVLPVTGRGSALPTAFIAVGLLGAGGVALAFARRNSATRTSQS